ncbi:MAG: HD domain-containing protein [Oligoflexus sp.]
MQLRQWKFWQQWSCDPEAHIRLEELRHSGDLSQVPELQAMIGVPQDPIWHPEGDVWIHTVYVCEQATQIASRDGLSSIDQTVLMMAALCHDIGKASTTSLIDGKWRAFRHAEIGGQICARFLEDLACPPEINDQVRALVEEHLVYASYEKASKRAIKRLLKRLEPAGFEQLQRLIEADHSGRPPLPKALPDKVLEMRRVWLSLKRDK